MSTEIREIAQALKSAPQTDEDRLSGIGKTADITNHLDGSFQPPTNCYKDFIAVVRGVHCVEDFEGGMAAKLLKPQIIQDSIHGPIEMPGPAVAIINTPQFQRLRNIKQLGNMHLVYPSATHTRFEHSLGVGHLAREMVTALKDQQPELGIDEKDVTCVMLAGLCHDLGHGPFSHFWEYFIQKARPDEVWYHEDASIQMLDYLIKDNNLEPVLFDKFGLRPRDILFIKELIAGPIDEKTGLSIKDFDEGEWRFRGRDESKSFLYEIVANKISGIDVDKWDYFLRDQHNLNIRTVFDHKRFIKYSRVLKCGNPPRFHICLRDRAADTIVEMFQDRTRLHKHGYQHRVSKIISQMMLDALLLAQDDVKFSGGKGELFSMADCHKDLVAFTKLSDYVTEKVKDSSCQPAIDLLTRIMKRDLYRVILELPLSREDELALKSNDEICQEIRGCVKSWCSSLKPEDLFVIRRNVTFGMGNQNPVGKAIFYRQKNGEYIVTDRLPIELSDTLMDVTIFVCCKRNDDEPTKLAALAVKEWAEIYSLDLD